MPLHFFRPIPVIMMTLLKNIIIKNLFVVSVILSFNAQITWAGIFDIFDQNDYANYFPLGEWRLGMSFDDVRELPSVPALEQGLVPGILEASGIRFLGKDVRISFVFDEDALTYSQLWLYEGSNRDAATKVWLDLFDHLNSELGGVIIPNVEARGDVSREDVNYLVDDLLNTSKQVVKNINARNATKAS